MKLGIVGKEGTGKTTLAALISTAYVDMGRRVVAVDTDSNPNLALSLGLDEAVADQAPLVPRSLVVGGNGGVGSAQLLADYGVRTPAGVTLLHVPAGRPGRLRVHLRRPRQCPQPPRRRPGRGGRRDPGRHPSWTHRSSSTRPWSVSASASNGASAS